MERIIIVSSSIIPTSRWAAEDGRSIAFLSKASRGSAAIWSKTASTFNTNSISNCHETPYPDREGIMNLTTRIAIRFLAAGLMVAGLLPAHHALAQPETLTIAAANSVKDALRKLLPQFESQHPEIKVRVIY